MYLNKPDSNNHLWKERYNKNQRPPGTALHEFWSDETRKLFEDFSNEVSRKYSIVSSRAPFVLTHQTYTVTYGWKWSYSLKTVPVIKNVYILDDGFCIDNYVVKSVEDYEQIYDYIETLLTDDFYAKYNEKIMNRNKKQIAGAKRLHEREKKAKEEFKKIIDSNKLNKFVWFPKIADVKIKRLYESDAEMIYNEELVDEVGYTLYIRCLQGRDERLLANEGKLKCHHCGAIHISPPDGKIICSCGYAYIFPDYMRSFNKDSMPSRSATPFFNEFIKKWEKAKTYADKMMAVDYVIHECHLDMLSGVKRNFAGGNLISGKNIQELILSLAYE